MAKKKQHGTYSVVLPICGSVFIEVEATDEDDAIEQALNRANVAEMESWQAFRIICEGNLFHGEVNEAYAELNK